jgi:hypothetical protein
VYDELRKRGFYLAERSHANYQRTSMSLASTLSAELLDKRGRAEELWGPTDMSGPYSRIQNSNVARFLKSRGYTYVHVGGDFAGTQTNPIADLDLHYDSISEFGTAFLESTALPGLARGLGVGNRNGNAATSGASGSLTSWSHSPTSPGRPSPSATSCCRTVRTSSTPMARSSPNRATAASASSSRISSPTRMSACCASSTISSTGRRASSH